MGRKRLFEGAKYFSIECNRVECLLCDFTHESKSSSVHSNVLRHHLNAHHKDVERPTKQSIELLKKSYEHVDDACEVQVHLNISRNQFKKYIVMALTDGVPWRAFQDGGLSKLIQPIASQIDVEMNETHIQQFIDDEEKRKKEEISAFLNGRMPCVKIHISTRNPHHFLEVSILLYDYEKEAIHSKTLGTDELTGQVTTDSIHDSMLAILDRYDLTEDRIYSVSTGYGIPMKTSNDRDSNGHPVSDTKELSKALSGIRGICGAAYPFQSAIEYSMHNAIDRSVLKNIRRIAKKCQNLPTTTLGNSKIRLSDIDGSWHTTYEMVESFLTHQDQLNSLFKSEDLIIPTETWIAIKDLVDCLGLMRDFFNKFQSTTLAGDLLAMWITTKHRLESNGSDFALKLMESIDQQDIFKPPSILAAILVDLRYQGLLTFEEREIGMQHLLETWKRIKGIHHGKRNKVISTIHGAVSPGNDSNIDPVDLILLKNRLNDSRAGKKGELHDRLKIHLFNGIQLNRQDDILQYWSKQTDLQVRDLVFTVLVLPCI